MRTHPGTRCKASLAVAVILLLGWVGSQADAAEWAPGKRMTQAVGRVMDSVIQIADISDYGYDNGICIMAAFVRSNSTVAFERPLKGGSKYIILGGGDNDAEDVDIEVLDANKTIVAKDTDTDASPFVRFTAPRTGQYTIRQKLYKSARGSQGSFCVTAVLRVGGFDVPVRNLVRSVTRLIARCNAVDQNTSDTVLFHDQENQWAIYGSILKNDEEITITNVHLGQGRRVILSAGDENVKDIDLFLLDENNKVIAKDDDPDANPLVNVVARRRMSHGLRIKNAESRGAALVLSAILKVVE